MMSELCTGYEWEYFKYFIILCTDSYITELHMINIGQKSESERSMRPYRLVSVRTISIYSCFLSKLLLNQCGVIKHQKKEEKLNFSIIGTKGVA